MIIDVRCRVTTRATAEYYRQGLGARAPKALAVGTEEAFFHDLDEAGITVAVSPSGNNLGMQLDQRQLPPRTTSNDEQASIQERFSGRFVGVAGIDVGNAVHNGLEELERCVKQLDLRVATIEPGRAPLFSPNPADPRIYPFYDLAQDLEVPVIIQTSGILGGKNIDYAHPRWIDQLAEDFPKLTIICGHGCYPYVREMIIVAIRRENVYPSPDMYVFGLGQDDWIKLVNNSRLADKFLFGSGYPFCHDLRGFVDRFLMLPWKALVLDRILHRNALRALRLEDRPGFRSRSGPGPVMTAGRLRVLRSRALARRIVGRLSRPGRQVGRKQQESVN